MIPERKSLLRRGTLALVCAALALPFIAFAPKADAQVSLSVQIGAPPVCPYGYYEFAPYSCAPPNFYGPGYFYNGIFLGVGPWANWGYGHGWGSHRFVRAYGGNYYRGYWVRRPHPRPDHRWDHGREYGYYVRHDNGHHYGEREHGHYDRGRGHYKDHDNGRGHFDHGHGNDHDNGHGNGHGNGHR
jgi:hypothetical protein